MRCRNDITAEFLRSILHYDPETGEWKWLATHNKKHKNKALAQNTKRPPQININGKAYLASRLAWLYMTGAWPSNLIDHKDLNWRNNAWSNLREATKMTNAANTRPASNNTSGHKGVSWDGSRGKWAAYIKAGKKRKYLGRHESKEDAIAAYQSAALVHFGEFARFD